MNEIIKKESNQVARVDSIGIAGLVGFDTSDLPIPFVKLVQPVSQKIELASGEDAKPGTFYFSKNKTAKTKLDIVVLFAKKDTVIWEEGGEPQKVYKLLCIEKGKIDPFKMTVSGTAMWEWRSLLGLIYDVKAPHIWDYLIHVTSEQKSGDKGKWYSPKFKLGEELSDGDRDVAATIVSAYTAPEAKDNKESSEDVNPDDVPF